jgi:hypothetical protein
MITLSPIEGFADSLSSRSGPFLNPIGEALTYLWSPPAAEEINERSKSGKVVQIR